MPKDEMENIEKVVNKSDSNETKVSKKEVDNNEKTVKKPSVTFLIVAVFASIALSFAIFCAFMAAFMFSGNSNLNIQSVSSDTFSSRMENPRMHRVFIQTTSSEVSDNIMVSGVVKSVGTNTFVIAGNGNQTTVNTTGDTTYNTTDKKVSVNDSVMVIGTVSNKIVTATDVQIVNF